MQQSWHFKVEIILKSLRDNAQTITYDALATQAQIPGPHRIHKLTTYLEALIDEDIKAATPIRAALVISKIRAKPAPGFFDCLSGHGMTVDDDNQGTLHQQLLRALNPAF